MAMQQQSRHEHVFIIGAMKAGTTSLFHALAPHPRVAPCSVKEPNFFSRGTYSGSDDRYEAAFRFSKRTSVCLEESVSYSKRHLFPDVAEKIYAFARGGGESSIWFATRLHEYAATFATRAWLDGVSRRLMFWTIT